MNRYNFNIVEEKWQKYWYKNKFKIIGGDHTAKKTLIFPV